jgi:3-oxoadipate enol-lactonase
MAIAHPEPGVRPDLHLEGEIMKANIAGRNDIEYDDFGRGQPLVLLHAFPLDRAMWRAQVQDLGADHRVLAPDLRGFGGSSPFLGPPSVEVMADDVASLLDALKITEPVALGGLSMGGYVALAFARRHPLRLRALILADTKAEADDAAAKANRNSLIDFTRDHSAADVIERLLPKLVGEQTRAQRPDVLDEVRRIASAQTPSAIINALQALRDRPDATLSLADIKVPTLVIVGAEDALTPPTVAQVLVERIPRATLVKIESAGHLSNLEYPSQFTEEVRSFLRGLS